MTETSSKTASSLAITEKRPQKSNSCVGVFFQLFDWNRRLAKKKLFFKKLFPPVGAKRVSSKFGSDEKLPMAKLLLIADENRGGFPSMKRTGKDSDAERSAMRKPGLVARLMGLESMPVVHRDKAKKAPNSDFYLNQGRKHVDNSQKASEFCCDRNPNSEKGLMKVGSRPPKLRKTGFFDRRTVAKVGAEALHFKNVFPQSRKQRHKLSSPVKSPRRLSGRNAARLVEAATRILEPGLQATNRARFSLTYSPSPCISLDDHAPIEGTAFSLKQIRQPTGPIGAKSLNVQSTCNSCGNFVDAVNFIPNVEEQVTDFGSSSSELTSEFSNASSHGSENRMRSPKTSLEQDGDADGARSVSPKCHRAIFLAAQAKSNLHRSTQNVMNEKPHIQRNQKLFSMARECRPQPVIDSISSKQNNQRCNQMMPAKDRGHERTNLFSHQIRRDSPSNAVNRSKDYVASNRNLSHTTRRQTSTRVLDGAQMKMERSSWEKKDDSLSTVNNSARKRRPVNSSLHGENRGFANSTRGKQRSITSDVIHRNGSAPFVRSVNQCSDNKAFPKRAEGNDARNSKDTDPAFFTFTSKKKQGTSSSSVEMEKQSKGEVTRDSSHNKEAMLDANNDSSLPLRRATGFKGDALGALLEQKLKELTCLERDESITGDTLSGRSTAILQELISALSMSRPNSQVNADNCSDGLSSKDNMYSNSPMCCDCTHVQEMAHSPGSKFQFLQTEAKEEVCLQLRPLATDCDHPSPTSILEVSFSNDSYLSESPNYCSGHKLDNRSRLSHCQMQPQLHDPDLLDSATSINSRKVRIGTINNISSMLSIDTDEIGLTGVKLNYARDVIMTLELLFETLARYDADGIGADTLVDPLFLDKLEVLAEHLWGSPRCSLGIPDVQRNQLRGFLFDCMVESLDSRYSCYLESGFREWSKLPLSLSRGRLAGEIFEDIRKWRNLAGKDLDCIVEREMSNSFVKWTDFKPVVFDMGVEIERDILQILLDDMVMDLWQCSVGSV